MKTYSSKTEIRSRSNLVVAMQSAKPRGGAVRKAATKSQLDTLAMIDEARVMSL